MSNLPNPPPHPTYSTPRLRDITLATITAVTIRANGEPKEVSCVSLRDLIEDSSLDPIPRCIDAAWIFRLSYVKWMDAVIEDMNTSTQRRARPAHGWKMWIPVGTKQLQVLPYDRGFRAAIAKWLVLNPEEAGSAITIVLEQWSDQELEFRFGGRRMIRQSLSDGVPCNDMEA